MSKENPEKTGHQPKIENGNLFTKLQRFLSETWLLAALPFVGYYFAFQFEAGFCEFFGCPRILIDVDLNRVIEFTGVLAAVTFGVICWVFPLLTDLLSLTDDRSRLIKRYAFVTSAAVAVSYLGFDRYRYWLIGGLGAASVLIILDVLGVLLHRKKDEPFILASKRTTSVLNRNPIATAYTLLGPAVITCVLALSMGALITFRLGKHSAGQTTDFSIFQSDTNLVVLRKYGENLVCVRINTNSMLTGEVEIYPGSKETGHILRNRRMGPLRIQ